MKRVSVFFFALLLISASSIAKDSPIQGSWLLTKVVMEGETQELYSEVTFKNDGYAEMEGRVFGTWVYNKKSKTVTIESEMIKEFAGEWKFTKPTKGEILLSGSEAQLFFMKLDREKIALVNEKSGFIGVWKLNTTEGTTYMKFEAPNILSMNTKTDYGSSNGGGTWMYNQGENSIILITNDRELSGMSQVQSINESEFALEKNGITLNAEKLSGNSGGLEELKFTTEDIYESLNNYEKDVSIEAANTSWINPEAKSSYLKNIKNLKYNYSSLIEEINVFISEVVTGQVTFDEDYGQVSVEPIFGELSARDANEDNPFYPLEELDTYRVTGEETITVPAGTFNCLVIEAVGGYGDQKQKFYMINNRPGVYAKIVLIEGEGDDQNYSMYELAEIDGSYETRSENNIIGKWLMVKTVTSGKNAITSTSLDFINDGRLSNNNTTRGGFYSWTADESSKHVSLNFDGDIKEFNLTKITNNDMVLQNDELTYYLAKWDNETIAKNNKNSPLKGFWILTEGGYDEFSVLNLAKDNNYYEIDGIQQMPIADNYNRFGGKWLHLDADSTLVFSNNNQESSFTGSYKITLLTKDVMVLDRRIVYLRIDPEVITKKNKESGIEGVWKIKSNGNETFFEFKAPYEFKKGGSQDELYTQGLWFYNPDTKILFVGVAMHQLGGSNKVSEITVDKILFENGLVVTRVK